MGNLVKSPAEPGSGWSLALTSAGYKTQAQHFYPKGTRTSVCSAKLRRYSAPVPKGQLAPNSRLCKGCEQWVEEHPHGIRNYTSRSSRG